jgi:outer membrane protein assembly factor BamD (BamD/ComL family)
MKNSLYIFIILATIISSCGSAKKEFYNLQKSQSIEVHEAYLEKYPKSPFVNEVRSKLSGLYEKRDWEVAQWNNTINSFNTFISKYPQSVHKQEAIKKKEALEEDKLWKESVFYDLISRYEDFINRYPNSTKVKEAERRISELREKDDWEMTSKTHRISQIEAFLKKYPNSRYELSALGLIEEIKEETDWNFAKQEDSALAYEIFLNKYPQSKFGDEAREIVKELRVIQPEWERTLKKNTPEGYRSFMKKFDYSKKYWNKANEKYKEMEDAFWNKATTRNTIRYYQDYIDKFPDGEYIDEVDKRLIDLEVEKAFKGDHGELPPLGRSGYSTFNDRNEVQIENDTGYKLTVLYSGTESKRIIINPKRSATLTLPNGKYRIAAMVDASNIQPYAGEENLQGGEYSSKFYIQYSRN